MRHNSFENEIGNTDFANGSFSYDMSSVAGHRNQRLGALLPSLWLCYVNYRSTRAEQGKGHFLLNGAISR